MNNKEQPNMQSITALVKFLIDSWHNSKCPVSTEAGYCAKCKYNGLCTKIEELEKVVNE